VLRSEASKPDQRGQSELTLTPRKLKTNLQEPVSKRAEKTDPVNFSRMAGSGEGPIFTVFETTSRPRSTVFETPTNPAKPSELDFPLRYGRADHSWIPSLAVKPRTEGPKIELPLRENSTGRRSPSLLRLRASWRRLYLLRQSPRASFLGVFRKQLYRTGEKMGPSTPTAVASLGGGDVMAFPPVQALNPDFVAKEALKSY